MIHLHRHSEYSRLDGVGTAKQYATRAAELGQGALALTDHGTLSGALHHVQACRDAGIMPIAGVEAYFRPNRAQAKADKQREAWHLCLFAKNLRGWHSLLRLVSATCAETEDGGGFYQYPCMDWDLLERHREGLMASTACYSSWLAKLVYGGDSMAVRDYIDRMLKLFGDDLFIEIMPHDFDDQRTLNIELVRIAQERSIPIIATNDAHFPYKDWAETQRVAKMMGSGLSFEKLEKLKEKGKDTYLAEVTPTLYLAHEEEMRHWFAAAHPDLPEPVVDESIANTDLFIQRIKPYMLDKTNKMPRITKSPAESERILREWIEEGLERVIAHREIDEAAYRERLEYEFDVLKGKGALDYFVLLGKVVRWAKGQGIRVGLGRGSAAGCLVSYLIGITNIDPIPYGLLFERFLNPERRGMPDIDIDFQGNRRGEVKSYIASLVGQDHVADIITHSTFQPKKVLQSLCRVYDVPYLEAHDLTDTIEIRQDDEETTLEELLPLNDKLQAFKEKYPHIWRHALRLEGTVANAGKHAAGIIVTDRPVADYMALERGKKGDLVTSWSDSATFPVVSDYGFLKYDFLGIKGLDKHDYTCKLVERMTGVKVDLDGLPALYDPYAVDDDVMEGFCQGYTIGVFQFGGRGITNLLREIRPENILDLAAANAIYRPGPMKGGVTWDYAKRKHDPSLRSFWHELVRPVLEETYGIVAYQEQVMKISQIVGGFSGAEADDLRKAMGKLYRIKGGTAARDFMGQFESKWFAGAAHHGLERKVADEIWHKILQFGSYGFNKSHSASYALQAYQDMYLKMKYPAAFYAAFLSYEDNDEKRVIAIREARTRGIKIKPPCVNRSGVGWNVDDKGALRIGLTAIKGVGAIAAAEIIREQPFGGIEDFDARTSSKCNVKIRQALWESGAFDKFGARDGLAEAQIAQWEKERLNMSLTVAADSMKHADLIRPNIWSQDEVSEADIGTHVVVGGEITEILRKKTKKGDPFANVTIAFEMNEWRVKLWQRELARFDHLLIEGAAVMVAGRKDEWQGYVSVIVNDMTDVETLANEILIAGV